MANQEQGIKLFGRTITFPGSNEAKKDDQPADPTAEKRPEKIIPCPRCKSMETKFCYFNNYNVNQPRHFCKGCQRYWTAGGALRNVPVGAGRRKAKPPGRVGFGEGCLFDGGSGEVVDWFELDGTVIEEWNLAANREFQHVLHGKRRRSGSAGLTC